MNENIKIKLLYLLAGILLCSILLLYKATAPSVEDEPEPESEPIVQTVSTNDGRVSALQGMPTPTPTPTPKPLPWEVSTVSADEIELLKDAAASEYYSSAAFVGDSIMLGFSYYSRYYDSYIDSTTFLAAGSYSVREALKPTGSSKFHPIYQGQKRNVWESLRLAGCDKVFILFGMNDISVTGKEDTCDKFVEFVGNIKEECPDIEVNIISMTYTKAGCGKGKLNNDNIREFNSMLEELCKQNNWGYCPLAELLSDGNGNLKAEYCTDGFVHQTMPAYAKVWAPYFRDYAIEKIEEKYYNRENE